MRLNVFIANQTGLSRRASDKLISNGDVFVNSETASLGIKLTNEDRVQILGSKHSLDVVYEQDSIESITIMINKPAGYVCSRSGQGNKTIYDLLPGNLHSLKTVGRLDKDSSGLLLLTNDGQLAHKLTHPSHQKTKIYEVTLNKRLQLDHQQMINNGEVILDDGPSQLMIEKLDNPGNRLRIKMSEGRNRQIRRTFESLGYKVEKLYRTTFGPYKIGVLGSSEYTSV